MGRSVLDFERNRREKIARNTKKRKNKKYNPLHGLKSNKRKKQIKSRVLNILNNNNFYSKILKIKNKVIISIPKIFCFIDNADETINILKQINSTIFDDTINEIFLDYSNCEVLGLDASLVTDIIVLNGIDLRKNFGYKTFLSGTIPKSEAAREMFLNSGLVKHLGISKIESPDVKRLDPFIYEKETNLMTNKVIEYYNNCLSTSGFILNNKGIIHFNKLVGEIIDNANQHCGKNGTWYVSGHFSKNPNNGQIPKGRLTFISLGNTIYESLKYNTLSDSIKIKLENQTKLHERLFNFGWNEESSWTVFALQWMISRKKTDDNDRGTGTIKFIESFTELGKTINNDIPKMIILSGHTHILFDGTYTLKYSKEKKNTKVIAFNKTNDLSKRPDDKYVKLLKNKFPGVIISCEFYVDKEYLKKIKEEK